jgi:hypothetical protein
MRVVPLIAVPLLALALLGCGSSTAYDATADRAAIQEAIRSAWNAEYAGDESTACLYYTKTFIEEQNRLWEAGSGDTSPHRTDCATGPSGSHPYLRLTNPQGESGNERVRFAWTRVSHKSRTATAQPILPGGLRCLNPVDCHVVISMVIHLDEQNGRWLIDDLEASACEVHGSCVPLDNNQLL